MHLLENFCTAFMCRYICCSSVMPLLFSSLHKNHGLKQVFQSELLKYSLCVYFESFGEEMQETKPEIDRPQFRSPEMKHKIQCCTFATLCSQSHHYIN